jgi:hypothetical protein
MTRTTDIAHFYKVTTALAFRLPELGKLLEGAYITSTDKTVSFVVGGVGKTKSKTAWEFDAQGRMVINASTKDIKYDKFRGKDDLLILPGACPQWCKAIVVCRMSEITSQVKSSQRQYLTLRALFTRTAVGAYARLALPAD